MDNQRASEDNVPLYTPLYDEYDYVVSDHQGQLPQELQGTLYRNGPGKLDAGGQQLGHLFDGDGMLSMFSIADQTLRYRNRYVRTKHYQKSLLSNGAPYRALGTMRPGGLLANALRWPANVANTSVAMHAGKLLALWEGGFPTAIDPDTLGTIGPHDFNGELKWLGTFSAHPKWDPATGDMFNFGLAIVPKPKLICYRVDSSGTMHRLGQLDLPLPMFNHDVALTARHLVFVIPPLVFPTAKLFAAGLALRNYFDAIEYQASRGTMIGIVPRDGGKPRIIYTDPLLHLHLGNAYDDGTDVVVDLVNYDASWRELNDQLNVVRALVQSAAIPYGGYLRRLRITPSGKVSHEQLTDLRGEFPTFNLSRTGSCHRYTYLSGATGDGTYPNMVAKVDNATGARTVHLMPPGHLAHEAVFAARPGATEEDDGWLLVVTQDNVDNLASLVVLDAKNLAAEPIYTGRLRHHLPLTLHGCFTSRVARPV